MKQLIFSLKPYFFKYKNYYFLGALFILISNAFAIYPAQIVRESFDYVGSKVTLIHNATVNDAINYKSELFYSILYFTSLMLIAAVLRGVFLFAVRQAIIVVSRHIEYDQKNELFNHIQTLSPTVLKDYKTGDLMARIAEDVGNVRMFTGPGVMYTINTGSLFLMVFFTMLFVNAKLTLYVLIPLPILTLLIYWVHSKIIEKSDALQTQLSLLSNFTNEAFSGIRLIRGFGKEKKITEIFYQESESFKKKGLALAFVDAFFYPMVMILVGMSTLFTIWIGGIDVLSGNLTIGNIAEFILYVNLLTWPIATLGWITSLIQKAAVSQNRINEILNLKSDIIFGNNNTIPKGNIEYENVSYKFSGSNQNAISNVSFELKSGEVLGIMGGNGSGKTTLIHLLTRVLNPDSGTIFIDNQPITNYSKESINQLFSIVSQDVFLFSDTIANNINFSNRNATQKEIEEAAKFACVYNDIMDFPHQFETIIGERGVTLSGGQKQRISIARAYLKKSPILIFDDSLSAVDTQTESNILQNIKTNLGHKPTLIIISHRVSSLKDANLILHLENGKLLKI